MKRFNILVGIIAIFDDRVLLMRRSLTEGFLPGVWGPPCGKIVFGERLEDAVRRELLEETALQVNRIKKIVGYSMFISEMGGDELHNLQINYLIEVVSPEPVKLDKSHDAYQWVSKHECESVGLSSYALSTIMQGFASYGSSD
jgi:8-oxo-dGTP diphosphatase